VPVNSAETNIVVTNPRADLIHYGNQLRNGILGAGQENDSRRRDSMKLISAILIVLLLVFAVSCGSSPPATGSVPENNVGFSISANHFVKNTYKGETNPSYVLIRSYSSFDSLFGVASVMGMDKSKLISEEKMKSGFVFSIIYQGNDIHEFGIEKITLKDKQLQVYYSSKVTEQNASWTCNCHITALIDNCEFSSIVLFENGRPLPDAKIKEL